VSAGLFAMTIPKRVRARMKETGDQIRAQRLLSLRDHGPNEFSTFFKLNATRYMVRFTLNAVGLTMIAFMGLWVWFAFFLGMVVGSFLRDMSWVRSNRRTWPFTKKVTNWDVVETLAAAQPPPETLFSQVDRP
jgi:hypothetical protein